MNKHESIQAAKFPVKESASAALYAHGSKVVSVGFLAVLNGIAEV